MVVRRSKRRADETVEEFNRRLQRERLAATAAAEKTSLSPRDPAREELRQKQLREDPLFAEKLRVVEEREAERVAIQAQEELITPEQRAIEIERERLITEEAPVRRSLAPTTQAIEKIPVVGPLFKELADKIPGFKERSTEMQITPEELRTEALSEIERNEIEKGLTSSEKFGRLVESLGVGGLSNFVAEKPSENVQTVLRGIKILKTRATDAESKVIQGLWPQSLATQRLDDIELEIQTAESRIRLLIQNSPELKFNSDGVNFIELKLLEARERVFNARLGILEGKSSDPTDLQVLTELQRSINEEDFEIT